MPIGACVRLYAANEIDDEVEKVTEILSVISGLTPTEVMALPIADYTAMQKAARWVWDEPKPATVKKRYTVGQYVCKVTQTVGAMTAAQFIDFQNCAAQEGDIVDVLAVALVPEGCVYGNGYDYDELKRAIADTLPTTDAVAILPFFVASLVRSCGDALLSSGRTLATQARRKRDKAMMRRAKELLAAGRSLRAGGGFRRWRLWPR